jgi:hypothetical protein
MVSLVLLPRLLECTVEQQAEKEIKDVRQDSQQFSWDLGQVLARVRFQFLTAASIRPLIALMIEAVRTSETSVNIYLTTQQCILEDSKLQVLARLYTTRSHQVKQLSPGRLE